MDSKRFQHVDIKSADKGEVSAVFSTFNTIDLDGDVTDPAAFTDGAEVVISSYGHTSHDGVLPVGKGVIRTTKTEAIMDGKFFLDTTGGRDTFTVVKELGPLGQWSYGYDVQESAPGTFEGTAVRFLKRLKVHEVSPVLIGAGINTRTVGAKSFKPWADVLPHHHDDGTVDVRAVLKGIARCNGVKGVEPLAPQDIRAAYDHLAAHLVETEHDVPALRTKATDTLRFNDEAIDVITAMSSLTDRARAIKALRSEQGKAELIAPQSRHLLAWLRDEVKSLDALLENESNADTITSDDVMREWLRYVASTYR
jgi:hypothetical protein